MHRESHYDILAVSPSDLSDDDLGVGDAALLTHVDSEEHRVRPQEDRATNALLPVYMVRWSRIAIVSFVLFACAVFIFSRRHQSGEFHHAARAGYQQLLEVPVGACPRPESWCIFPDEDGKGSFDLMTYRDCDSDGVPDPYCEGPDLLKFGYLGSSSGCKDNWPNGYCVEKKPKPTLVRNESLLPASGREITIIHFNDVYQVTGVLDDGVRRGGLSRAAHVIKQSRWRNPDRTFVTFGGDLLSPSVISDLFEGEQMVDIFNRLTIDAAVLGNHEFDFGMDVLVRRVNESNFPWLNINLMDVSSNKTVAGSVERLVKDVPFSMPFADRHVADSTRVCFFGAAYDVRQSISKDRHRIHHLPTIEAAQAEAARLRQKENCKVVVALTHQFSRDDCDLSGALGKDVDLIVGGHDHSTEYQTKCGDAPFVKGDSDLKTSWVTKLWLSGDGRVETIEAEVLALTDDDPFDMDIHQAVLDWDQKGKDQLKKVVGCTEVDLDLRDETVRRKESLIGNFFADAVQAAHHTDVVLLNGGMLRGNDVVSKGGLNKFDLIAMHPFGNAIVKIYATGQQVRDFINKALDCYSDVCGDFPDVAGLKYAFDPSAPKGHRLKKITFVNGSDIPLDATLTLATTDFLLAGGKAETLAKQPLFDMVTLNDKVPVMQSVFDAFKGMGTACIHPKVDGRIIKQ